MRCSEVYYTCSLCSDVWHSLIFQWQFQQARDVFGESWEAGRARVPLHHHLQLGSQILPVSQKPFAQSEHWATGREFALPRVTVWQCTGAQHLHSRHRLTWKTTQGIADIQTNNKLKSTKKSKIRLSQCTNCKKDFWIYCHVWFSVMQCHGKTKSNSQHFINVIFQSY